METDKMKLRRSVVAIVFAAGLMGVSTGAHALLFQFNPTGGGPGAGLIDNAAVLDQLPGNDLAQAGSGGGAPLPNGTIVSGLYQSNLGTVLGAASNTLYTNGGSGAFFTFVAGFNETVTSGSINVDGSI